MEQLKRILKEWVIPYGTLIIVVLLLSKYVFFLAIVPSGSMHPTIREASVLFTLRVHDLGKLERGDIVVFYSDELEKTLVKRLIGLPGEEIVIDDKGVISVDGTVLDEPYVKFPSYQSGSFQVPEDSYFFLGDNRSDSFDARSWQNPYIPADKVEGKAVFTLWPLNKFGTLK